MDKKLDFPHLRRMTSTSARQPETPDGDIVSPDELRLLKNEIELLKVQHAEIKHHTAEAILKTTLLGKMQYALSLTFTNLVFANNWQRRHFLLLVIQWMPRHWQKLRQRITGFVTPGKSSGSRHCWNEATTELSNKNDLLPWLDRKNIFPLRVIVLGAGGIGDVLRTTPILRTLKEKVPSAQICLVHTNPDAANIVRGNTNLFSAGSSPWWTFPQIANAALREDVADLIVHFRYTVSYTPSDRLRSNQEKIFGASFFEQAAAAHAPWDQYMYRFPHFINMLCRQADELNIPMYDLMGLTANLPISRQSIPHIEISEQDRLALRQIPEARYITVHNGAQKSMMAHVEGGRITKMMPQKTWDDIVRQLRKSEHTIIQLGESNEPLIEGVSVDLRGKLSIHETAAVLQKARCHVDTEGGLMHVARAVKTRCVIVFGPTSAPFFGYDDNLNIEPRTCSNCYWVRSDWYAHCPLNQQEPECMSGHRAEDIVAAVETIVRA